ncbi:uncharacterized protein BYT42DRAFT_554719 [Radiomyces spectabilis]|uniref:uncharacterized protein n=1 Tax=Radiomyces spectabilis TaxID=64574 RepID=UPI0022209759|nr:uncharacterized protein BYT42DRAFT_554719 [Radiomyces spectabilis]KAI8390900.1 hypothetical protein BYT42DRAFT_554719 [Radiomyces spectabilis]
MNSSTHLMRNETGDENSNDPYPPNETKQLSPGQSECCYVRRHGNGSDVNATVDHLAVAMSSSTFSPSNAGYGSSNNPPHPGYYENKLTTLAPSAFFSPLHPYPNEIHPGDTLVWLQVDNANRRRNSNTSSPSASGASLPTGAAVETLINHHAIACPPLPSTPSSSINHKQKRRLSDESASVKTCTDSHTTEDSTDDQWRAQILMEKRRHRRESHNAVERRRRNTINENIQHLGRLLPEHMLAHGKISKGTILKGSVAYIHSLHNQLSDCKARLASLQQEIGYLNLPITSTALGHTLPPSPTV